MELNKAEIIRLTQEYGGGWGLNHTSRLLQLIHDIGQDLVYDSEALWLAAHLHDWGAYVPWVQKEVDHVQRSMQVVEPFLADLGCPEEMERLVLECILLHHTPGSDRSLESILLRDADALDFLGVVGVLRNFSMNPRDLRKGFEETKRRQNKLSALLVLDKAKAIAAERVREMDTLLARFEMETLGCF